jgi:hypothetical protein
VKRVALLHWNAREAKARAARLRAAGFDVRADRGEVRGLLPAGLVDYKIIAVDETWSGLLFTWRKRAPRRA